MPAAIAAVQRAFARLSAGEANVPVRTALTCPPYNGVTLIMPAHLTGDPALGCKIVSVRPDNRDRGLRTIFGLILLIDAETGEPRAAMEAAYLTALRTGAASGAATDRLARADSRVLACFGAGAQAETQIEAVCSVRPIERVWIRGRTHDSAKLLAQKIAARRDFPSDIRVADTPSQALVEADIICTATTSHTPVFDGDDVRPGVHINAIGSYTTDMQEVDARVLSRARIFVDSREACLAEAGDLVKALANGAISGSGSWVELGDVLLGRAVGRCSDDEITYFKSVGNAVQDVATAQLALIEAERRGLGVEVEL
jgi:alanine dehydrogenase